mgnify:FL=1
MSRRNQQINVKVPRKKVIASLEKALKKLESNWENQAQAEEKYQKELEKWKNQLIAYAIKNMKKASNFRANYRSWNNILNIDFDLVVNSSTVPTEPKRTVEVLQEYTYNESHEEISNAIRILQMCEDEYISTATYGQISKYL